MGVNPLLYARSLLRPIHTGIAEVLVCVCRSAPGFVAVGHLCWKHRHGRDNVTCHQCTTDPNPATARLHEGSQARCGQQRGQWIQEQNMTSADVHPAEDRHREIDSSGHYTIRYFSSEFEA